MRRVIWLAFVIMSTIAAIFVLWQFRGALWLFLLALVASATLRPYIQFFREQGLSWRVALVFGYGLVILTLLGVILTLGYFLLIELQQLGNETVLVYDQIRATWPNGSMIQQTIVTRLPPSSEIYGALVSARGFEFLQTLTGITSNFTESIALFIIVLVMSVYIAADQARFEKLILSFIPVRYRAQTRLIWRDVESTVGDYTRSELIQSLLAALLFGVGYWLLGLDYPILLALMNAIVWFIPILGFILALIPVTLLALATGDVGAWLAIGYTALVLLTLELLIEPRFFNRRRFSGLFLVFMLIAFVEQMGLIGFIIAPPVTVAIQILFGWMVRERITIKPASNLPTLEQLKARVAELEADMNGPDVEATPKLMDLIARLKRLMNEAEKVG